MYGHKTNGACMAQDVWIMYGTHNKVYGACMVQGVESTYGAVSMYGPCMAYILQIVYTNLSKVQRNGHVWICVHPYVIYTYVFHT